jgi:TM2 domain-containing membrane protein YozV
MADNFSEYQLAKTKRKAIILSVLIPGLGQMYVGNFTRGTVTFLSALAILFFSHLILNAFEFIPPLIFYIWQIFDAGREYNKRRYYPVQGSITCMDCDWNNSTFSEFCSKCGNRIQNACTNCNNLNIIGVSFCGKCGKTLST